MALPFISLQKVTKSFVGQKGRTSTAIANFSLEMERGDFLCLLGPSGCGKTTVLGMLAGFEQPTAGEILLDGKPVRGPARDRGVVFQGEDSLYPWLTALDNIAFGPRMSGQPTSEWRARSLEFLNMIGLTGQGDKYPSELSGGMKQRIQIARALANEPKMLLMDEPFGALDAQTRSIMQQELRRIWLATNTSILFITHDVDEAIILGSKIGVMTAGPGGTLKGIVPVNLAGDRDRKDPAYTEIYSTVHDMIREEVAKASRVSAGVAA
jgi:NitT/TauT family transport system ATP-binding protein